MGHKSNKGISQSITTRSTFKKISSSERLSIFHLVSHLKRKFLRDNHILMPMRTTTNDPYSILNWDTNNYVCGQMIYHSILIVSKSS